jgi:tRNA A37 threonylcarbamoyladenosine synthetase subunit TsaC/SUA5/YrdC
MTSIPLNDAGIAQAIEVLEEGSVVCVPGPSPLPYALAATSPVAVNTAKGRPLDQPVGVAVADLTTIAASIDLPEPVLLKAIRLSRDHLFHVALPVQPDADGWVRHASSRGRIIVTLAWLPELTGMLEHFGHLFLSSANLTGEQAVGTAADADRALGSITVLDGDRHRHQDGLAESAAMISLEPDGSAQIIRDGFQRDIPEL